MCQRLGLDLTPIRGAPFDLGVCTGKHYDIFIDIHSDRRHRNQMHALCFRCTNKDMAGRRLLE